jgi:hypothetical protein
MMPETDITDIAGSHGSPLTGLSMMLTIDRFWLTLLTDRSDPGSVTTLVAMKIHSDAFDKRYVTNVDLFGQRT